MPIALDGSGVTLNTLSREYETIRAETISLIAQTCPNWTDFYPGDPGTALVEGLSGIADVLHFYADRLYGESLWPTAQSRQSVVNMARLIGYTPGGASCATVTVRVTFTGPGTLAGVDTVGSAPFAVASKAGEPSYQFELLEEYTAAGAGTADLVFIEGRSVYQENIGTSNGRPGQQFELNLSPLAVALSGEPALLVEAPAGTTWTQVPNFLDSTSTDKHYTLNVTTGGDATIRFGDGVNGAIPIALTTVLASYRVGGGAGANNLNVGSLTRIVNPETFVSSVVSTTVPSGGSEPESVQRIREQAPRLYATQDRAVTHEDYEAIARSVPGVARARAEWYNGPLVEGIYVATTGDNPVPSGTWNIRKQRGTGLLGAVGKACALKACAAVQIAVFPVVALPVEVDVTVYLTRDANAQVVTELVRNNIRGYLRQDTTSLATDLLDLSTLYSRLRQLPGVLYCDVNTFRRVPRVEVVRQPLATTTFSAVTQRGDTEEQEYTLTATSSTTFDVEGSVSGSQAAGTFGVAYTTDDGTLTFTLTAGAIPPAVGDQYRIVVGDTAGNVTILQDEVTIYSAGLVTVRVG